jgi:hypothetical protein
MLYYTKPVDAISSADTAAWVIDIIRDADGIFNGHTSPEHGGVDIAGDEGPGERG